MVPEKGKLVGSSCSFPAQVNVCACPDLVHNLEEYSYLLSYSFNLTNIIENDILLTLLVFDGIFVIWTNGHGAAAACAW